MSKFKFSIYGLVEKIKFIRNISFKGGIRLKWGIIISAIILVIILPLSYFYILMSSEALLSANDRLCKTIAGNIASAEAFIMVEKKPFGRSLILQDIVKKLYQSNINGLVSATVYDMRGMLAERKFSYAAHTNTSLRGKKIPGKLLKEIKKIQETKKRRIFVKVGESKESCYEYRIPFKFFNTRVGVIEIVFTEDSILGPVVEAKLYVVIAAIIMLLFGIIISRLATWRMVKTITELKSGVIRVGEGELDLRLKVNSHDEIGILTKEFNEMIRHLMEKLEMQKFVSNSTVSMIKEKAKGGKGKIKLGGKRMELAFLFSDIRGFTSMSEKLTPEEVVGIVNEYLDIQSQIIKKNGGDIDKFIGDEVMAVFSGKYKSDKAVETAVEIIKSINKLNKKRAKEGKQVINVGIGLNVGDVVHGRMGSRDRMDNTSIGDTVNLAARLCSNAEPGAILASKKIVTMLTKKKFVGKKLDPIKVKGKAKPISIFSITNVKVEP